MDELVMNAWYVVRVGRWSVMLQRSFTCCLICRGNSVWRKLW
jgi:hypothetical protein